MTIRARTPIIEPTIVAISDSLVSESPLPCAFEEPASVGEEPDKPAVIAIHNMSDGSVVTSIGKWYLYWTERLAQM